MFNYFCSDLQWIPRQLRESVSVAMLESPSPAVLDQYLPRIREVIVHLLHGLKGKQALLREKDRESRGSIRSSTTSTSTSTTTNNESWNREVPLAALNRGSGSQRQMMYPSSPPLPPISSPRMNPSNEYDPWSGGMPRPSMPTNDLSSRIMPRNSSTSSRAYSPPQQHSPNIQHMPLPSRSTSSGRMNQPPQPQPQLMQQHNTALPPAPPPAPPAPPRPDVIQLKPKPTEFDENDPNTASALAALKRQENLARRSSVRRASMFRGGNGEYTGGSISRGKGQQQHYFQQPPGSNNNNANEGAVPPVPLLPTHVLKNVDQSPSGKLNTVTEEEKLTTQEAAEEEQKDGGK